MNKPTDNTLHRKSLLLIIGAIAAAYLFLWYIVGGKRTIQWFDYLLFSLACGAAVAYFRDARDAMREKILDGGQILAVGIFLAWCAIAFARLASMAWSFNGSPPEWRDSGFWGLPVMVSTLAVTFHLLSPNAVGGSIPNAFWVKTGLWVAGLMFAISVALTFS